MEDIIHQVPIVEQEIQNMINSMNSTAGAGHSPFTKRGVIDTNGNSPKIDKRTGRKGISLNTTHTDDMSSGFLHQGKDMYLQGSKAVPDDYYQVLMKDLGRKGGVGRNNVSGNLTGNVTDIGQTREFFK